MEPKKDIFTVRVELKGETLNRFNHLWKRLGTESAAEVVRILITQEYDRIKREEGPSFSK